MGLQSWEEEGVKPGRVNGFVLESKRTTAQGWTEKKVFHIFWTTHLKLVLFCLLLKMFPITAVTGEGLDNPHLFTSHTIPGIMALV